MFDNVLRELKRLERTQMITVPIEADAEGYLDKECPSEPCLFGFKVHGDDWDSKVREEEVFCPSCRHTSAADNWFTRDQIEKAKAYAVQSVKRRINRAIRDDAASWNRRQPRDSFIKMTMNVKGGSILPLLPLSASEPMRLRTECDACGCRYSYIGAAYFCPSCGTNSASHTFRQTLATIRTAARNAPALRSSFDKDDAEVLIRVLLEKGIQDAVTSFQRLAEQAYAVMPQAPPVRRNLFQSLDAGSDAWKSVGGTPYSKIVKPAELAKLKIGFQQRHVLSHQGMVDQDYVDRSGDASYSVGQRLLISEDWVLEFVDLVEKLGQSLLLQKPTPPAP